MGAHINYILYSFVIVAVYTTNFSTVDLRVLVTPLAIPAFSSTCDFSLFFVVVCFSSD